MTWVKLVSLRAVAIIRFGQLFNSPLVKNTAGNDAITRFAAVSSKHIPTGIFAEHPVSALFYRRPFAPSQWPRLRVDG
ncbi:hypothetical protein [Azomonas macrocytogenes]|uniref:Uncharacterized protein n=1 Tax=Azomonas macrocytogenes TaxID=69962 RepID=A0A839T1R9_AZOMA|nr:hypothetical protein [Azomonas macrocytogenes]MBB3103048.1 hypothetical protein [Azomonas macrocytogenes]